MDQQSLCTFVATCAYLYLKMMGNSGVQAYGRFRYKSHKYEEDKVFFKAPPNRESQPEILTRGDACWRNDLENIPIFIVAALCGLMAGVPHAIYTPIAVAFCLARTVHSVSLVLKLQPWRFLGYITGVICTGAMFVLSLRQFGW